ncbi:MAG: hypothetical protein ABIG37_00760 [Nanoarchaeota archaeon]|nr:hypothetical protein [Nanoarchaeota archaeon]
MIRKEKPELREFFYPGYIGTKNLEKLANDLVSTYGKHIDAVLLPWNHSNNDSYKSRQNRRGHSQLRGKLYFTNVVLYALVDYKVMSKQWEQLRSIGKNNKKDELPAVIVFPLETKEYLEKIGVLSCNHDPALVLYASQRFREMLA